MRKDLFLLRDQVDAAMDIHVTQNQKHVEAEAKQLSKIKELETIILMQKKIIGVLLVIGVTVVAWVFSM